MRITFSQESTSTCPSSKLFAFISSRTVWLSPESVLLSASSREGNWEATAQPFLSGEPYFAAYSQNLHAFSQQSWASCYLGSQGHPSGMLQMFFEYKWWSYCSCCRGNRKKRSSCLQERRKEIVILIHNKVFYHIHNTESFFFSCFRSSYKIK